jgi:hypothetical protein
LGKQSNRTRYHRPLRAKRLESRCMLAWLPGDYDLSTVVDEDDFLLWRANFGEVGESPIDGNGNGVVDAADYTIWRDNLGKTLADVPPDAPRGIEARAVGPTSIEISWETAAYATSYVIFRAEIGSGSGFAVTGSTNPDLFYTDNTAMPDTLYEYRVVAQNSHGDSPLSQGAEATANQSNLTAYRPQSVQDPNNPVDAPIYSPFPKKPVWDQDETSSSLGPGIRVNLDDDNNNGVADRLEYGYEIPLENDLIEVKVDRLPGQGDMALDDGGNLSLFYDHDKETPIPFDPVTFNTEPLPFVNDTITVFVEWIGSGHGTDTLSLIDVATSTTKDVIRFHTFRSLVVVFGGRSQDPHDTDGDGSIGDPVGGSATNREGIFDLAQTLYDTGWDVMAFGSTDTNIDNVVSVAETEIKSAYDYRLLDPFQGGAGFSILGYSWGGGATHDLILQR